MEETLMKALCDSLHYTFDEEACVSTLDLKKTVANLIANGVTVPVRCRHCKFHHWEQEPCHGKTEHFCSVLNAQVFPDFYCYHGKPKEG